MDIPLHQLLLLAQVQHVQEQKIIQLHKAVPVHLLGIIIHQLVAAELALALKILLTIEVVLALIQMFQIVIMDHVREQKVLQIIDLVAVQLPMAHVHIKAHIQAINH